MAEGGKKQGFTDNIKDVLQYISQTVLAGISSPIAEGAEIAMRTIEERILRLNKKILRGIYFPLIIGVGGAFLITALLFFLIEQLSWTKTASFFFVGIIIFLIGLFLKLSESDR